MLITEDAELSLQACWEYVHLTRIRMWDIFFGLQPLRRI